MKRRSFFKTTGALSLAAGLRLDKAYGFVPTHNWEKYDFGSGPEVKGKTYPLEWACAEKINEDGSFTLQRAV